MKNSRIIFISGAVLLLLVGFWYWNTAKETKVGHNDLDGQDVLIFRGTTVCADCPGIDTTVTLKSDGTFTLSMIYLERNESKSFTKVGSWRGLQGSGANALGTIYELKTSSGEVMYYQQTGENIKQLDGEGNEIESDAPVTLFRQP